MAGQLTQKKGSKLPGVLVAVLKEKQLQRVADYIGREVGIQLPPSKKKLVEGRLRKRLIALGFKDFESYLNYTLDTPDGELEKLQLVDVITTNKTNFYREYDHFNYLEKTAIFELEKMKDKSSRQELHFWSAGCSSGEEAFTLSIVLNEIAENNKKILFNIIATDISQSCLQKASRAIYTENQIEVVPIALRKKYFLRSKNKKEELVQMGEELRRVIKFMSLNLMDKQFSLAVDMDVIFCRNVMIYFNDRIREELVGKFEKQLVDGGYLFVGHSESLNGIKTSLKQVAPMVYRKL